MANKKKADKKTKGKKGKPKKADGTPQILAAKGGLTASQFLKEVNMTLDEPLSGKALKDLQASIESVVIEQLEEGNPVNLFGLVKVVPRLHTKGERMVNSEFGNPDSKKVKKTYKAKTSFKTGQGIFTKKVKDAMPSTQKLAKKLGA